MSKEKLNSGNHPRKRQQLNNDTSDNASDQREFESGVNETHRSSDPRRSQMNNQINREVNHSRSHEHVSDGAEASDVSPGTSRENRVRRNNGNEVADVEANIVQFERDRKENVRLKEDLRTYERKIDSLIVNQIKSVPEVEHLSLRAFERHPEIGLRKVSEIPTFFTIKCAGASTVRVGDVNLNYLKATADALGAGVIKAEFILKSEGLPNEVVFSPEHIPELFDFSTAQHSLSERRITSDRFNLLMSIVGTMLNLIQSSRVIITGVNVTSAQGPIAYNSDYVSTYGMLKNKFINQARCALPSLSYNDTRVYMGAIISELFEEEDSRMCLGQVSAEVVARCRYLRDFAVITDQWFSTLHSRHMEFISSRITTGRQLIAQLETITLPNVIVMLQNPAAFEMCLYPQWLRRDADGSLLLFMVSTDRRKVFFDHLTTLLLDLHFVEFREIQELSAQLTAFSDLHAPLILDVLNRLFFNVDGTHVYQALTADMMTDYFTFVIDEPATVTNLIEAIMDIITVILWFLLFPAVAVENAPVLLFNFFVCVQLLCREQYSSYTKEVGFTNLSSDATNVPDLDSYLAGRITFPILTRVPDAKFWLFRAFHEIITLNGELVNTRDTTANQTPRLRDVRQYYQPWKFLPWTTRGVYPFDNAFAKMIHLVIRIVTAFQKTSQNTASKSRFGNTEVMPMDIICFFNAMIGEFSRNLAKIVHAQFYQLRAYAHDTQYIPDDTFTGGLTPRRYYPRLYGQTNSMNWTTFPRQRALVTLHFGVPLRAAFCVKSLFDVSEPINLPPLELEYHLLRQNQEEGMAIGETLYFARMLKYGGVDEFRTELYDVTGDYVSAKSYSAIVESLGRLENMDFSNLFNTLLSGEIRSFDGRARDFRIELSQWDDSNKTIPVPNSMYGQSLVLSRPTTERDFNDVARIFVPELSPISLFSRGLLIMHTYVSQLDPERYIDVTSRFEDWNIYLWDPNFITTVSVGNTAQTAFVLRLPEDDGTMTDYHYSTPFRKKVLLVLNQSTGCLRSDTADLLLPFLKRGEVAFLLSDVMVIPKPMYINSNSVTADYELEVQYKEILTGPMDARILLSMYDSALNVVLSAAQNDKEKWFYLIQPMGMNSIIIRDTTDFIRKDENFYISNATMWSYGVDGTGIKTPRGLQPKIQLPTVNYNNKVTIVDSARVFELPEIVVNEYNIVSTLFSSSDQVL